MNTELEQRISGSYRIVLAWQFIKYMHLRLSRMRYQFLHRFLFVDRMITGEVSQRRYLCITKREQFEEGRKLVNRAHFLGAVALRVQLVHLVHVLHKTVP